MTITKIMYPGCVLGCLAIVSLAAASSAYAGIGSDESPGFNFNALSCVPTPGVNVTHASSEPFTFNALSCVPTPGVNVTHASSEPFTFDALSCVPTPGVRVAAAESSPAFMSRVPGDSTLDCVVNVLDLIYVRNALGKDVDSGENWRSDVNNDGKVNVLDLIAVRNRLGVRCKR